jgi:sulfate adenylyltransferase subunit 2
VTAITTPALSHLRALEAEAIHVMREVAAERERPALLFSGGKDSIVLVRLAQKAFAPGKVPFPLLHIDTGHNFPEVIAFRDRLVEETGIPLLVGSVQQSIDRGRVRRATACRPRRCWTRSRCTSSTPASAAPAATRNVRAPRSAC